jgi:hypothetical protein
MNKQTGWPEFQPSQVESLNLIGDLEPIETFYEFDGPMIYSSELNNGTQVIVSLCEELQFPYRMRCIASKVEDKDIEDFIRGTTDVRTTLLSDKMWVVDMDHHYRPLVAYRVKPQELPEDALPVSGVNLHPNPNDC